MKDEDQHSVLVTEIPWEFKIKTRYPRDFIEGRPLNIGYSAFAFAGNKVQITW